MDQQDARRAFPPSCDTRSCLDVLCAHETEVSRLRAFLESCVPILKGVERRGEILKEKNEMTNQATDPSRLLDRTGNSFRCVCPSNLSFGTCGHACVCSLCKVCIGAHICRFFGCMHACAIVRVPFHAHVRDRVQVRVHACPCVCKYMEALSAFQYSCAFLCFILLRLNPSAPFALVPNNISVLSSESPVQEDESLVSSRFGHPSF